MFGRKDVSPILNESPLVWGGFVPPISADPNSEGLVICNVLPLDTAIMWIDFARVDHNNRYTIWVKAAWDDDSTRIVRRADVHFVKDRPGWPVAIFVNGQPERFDGMINFGFDVYPFERVVSVVQTGGRESALRYATLTGLWQPSSVNA